MTKTKATKRAIALSQKYGQPYTIIQKGLKWHIVHPPKVKTQL